MTDVLLAAGVLSLASAALLGWLIALHRAQPEAIKKIGIKAPHRIMQLHLDQVMMGLILLAVATAFPDVPDWVAIPLLVGTVLNPLGFVPLAFWPKCDETLLYRGGIGFSFIASTIGFVGLAVWVLAGR
jgi:hydroxylaminobenzene mutase